MKTEQLGMRAVVVLFVMGAAVHIAARPVRAAGADVITAEILGTTNWGTLLTCGDSAIECTSHADCNACSQSGDPCLTDDDCRTCSVSGAPCLTSDDCPDPASETCDVVQTCVVSGLQCDTPANSFSIGTGSCNVGDVPLFWCDLNSSFCDDHQHPVIAQNMYRYHDGRFEQIGMSWVKHGFAAVDGEGPCGLTCDKRCTISGQPCGTTADCGPGEGTCGTDDLLAVGCYDIYGATLNGSQFYLGPRSEVNAFTGTFPYEPLLAWRELGDTGYKRLIVHSEDLDPEIYPGAVYILEGHYVAADDAADGNATNNVSYRLVSDMVENPPGSDRYIAFVDTGVPTQKELAAVYEWKVQQPSVVETVIDVSDEGRFVLAADVAELGDGFWQYEYALFNINSHRSAGTFSVPLPLGAIVQNVGFHDVSYHSGEPISNVDWSVEITNSSITWSTESFAANPNANALRWSTLYNFRFESNIPPDTKTGQVLLGLFRPGDPDDLAATTVAPVLAVVDCNNNGIPDDTDVTKGTSDDCDTNGVPDECQADCNTNMIADTCDLRDKTSADCNINEVPDECETDCDGSGRPDNCDIDAGSTAPGGPFFCMEDCDPDCNDNGVPDGCDQDCNENGIPDGCYDDPLVSDTDEDGIDDCADRCRLTSPPASCTCPVPVCCELFGEPCILPCGDQTDWECCINSQGVPECIPSDLCRDGCLFGDHDDNGLLDLRDAGGLFACFSGSVGTAGYALPSEECLLVFDFDLDDDIDSTDYVNWYGAAYLP